MGEVLDDLVKIGVDAVHAQWSPDEFEKQAARHRSRITFWGGVERRQLERSAQVTDIREAVFRIRKALDYGAGGVISQVFFGKHIPLRNVATFFEQWLVSLSVSC